MSVFSKILRAGEGKKVRALQALVPDINDLERQTKALSDEALAHRCADSGMRTLLIDPSLLERAGELADRHPALSDILGSAPAAA